MRKCSFYSVEVQRESADFSDAESFGCFNDIRQAVDTFDDLAGHRRILGWCGMGAITSPVELLRV